MQLTTLGVSAANYVVAGYDVIDDGGMLPDVADALVVKAFGSSTLRAVLSRLQLHEVSYGLRVSAVESATMIVSAAVAEVDAFSVGLEGGLSGDASLDLTVTNWTLPNGGMRLWAIDVTNSQGLATPVSAYLHTNQVELVQVLGASGTSVGLATNTSLAGYALTDTDGGLLAGQNTNDAGGDPVVTVSGDVLGLLVSDVATP
jgi:hypothetical protein